MTDAELIRKQAERIIELENANNQITKLWNNANKNWINAERVALGAKDKLNQIKEQVEQYQFNSATNLQNKIKTILMSSDEESAEHQD